MARSTASDAARPWLGKWESTDRDENFQNFVDALGVPSWKVDHKVTHEISASGDGYSHRTCVPAIGRDDTVQFSPGQDGTSFKNGTEIKHRYEQDGQNLTASFVAPGSSKGHEETYTVNGDELEKTYRTGDVQAKKWYKRVE